MNDVLDYQAQHHLRQMIRRLPVADRYQLRNISSCGQKIIKRVGAVNGVYLMSDGEHSKFIGQAHCDNPFCCPICSAKVMEKYRSEIASAIDMFASKGYVGFMVTFTIPHLKFMKCRETTDILYDTWTYCRSTAKSTSNRTHGYNAFREFLSDLDIKHYVRVCEYTYSDKNGWHPHFHCLFWTKACNKDKVLDYEKKLGEFWFKQAERVTLKYWNANKLHEDREIMCKRLFDFSRGINNGVTISKKKDGTLMEAESSSYLTGWTADKEVTGNFKRKASHDGHYTPYQILLMAYNDKHWENVYMDFCLSVTRKPVHHRLNFSKTGVRAMIKEYRKTEGYKSSMLVKKTTSWETVAFFDEKSWLELLCLNESAPVLSNILFLAISHRELLYEYLENLGFERRRISPNRAEHIRRQCYAVEEMFNAA